MNPKFFNSLALNVLVTFCGKASGGKQNIKRKKSYSAKSELPLLRFKPIRPTLTGDRCFSSRKLTISHDSWSSVLMKLLKNK
jgi:hypothetical protein